jgi:small-conductance mechanosensitive channel
VEHQPANTMLPPRPPKTRRADWPIPTALIVLSLIPALGGVVRLNDLANRTAITPDNARFMAVPLPVVIHIIFALAFCVIGAFQFAPRFRQRHPDWHRMAGRWLMLAGLASALTGIWMTVFYSIPQALQGPLLHVVRLLVGAGMALSIVLAWNTVRRKNIAAHRAWMMRAYALGQGAGTQALIFVPYTLSFGQPNQITRDVLMTASWVINLLIVEWMLRRQSTLAIVTVQHG